MKTLRIDGGRLWASLMEMAQVGAAARGGVRRLALSPEDLAGRELLVAWCREAGLAVRSDAVGNLFARRAGTDPAARPVLCGSHLDTQPEGGRFDGAYGVLAALEIVRTLNDHRVATRAPLEIVNWTNEEGARFTPSLLGSGVFSGAIGLEAALAAKDAEGVTVAQALDACGYRSTALGSPREADSYFEAHIEQGPILEQLGKPIGVVSGGQAIRWLDVAVTGFGSHAGTTPMATRRDAMLGAAAMALELEALTRRYAPLGLGTIGQLQIPNSSRNTIPGQVALSVDLRHHQDGQMAAMEAELRAAFAKIAQQRGLSVEIATYLDIPATPFDPACVALVRGAAEALGHAHASIVSGAGHDAVQLARHLPSAMVFIPCVGGLSHNEAEDALPADVTAGADVLLHAVLARAGTAYSPLSRSPA